MDRRRPFGPAPVPRLTVALLASTLAVACAAGGGGSVPGTGREPGAGDGDRVHAALPPGFQRGMNLEPIRGFGRTLDLDRLPESLDRLATLGVDHVAVIPSFFQARLGDTAFSWRGGRAAVWEETREAIRAAHARGLRVLLKPHLWLEDRSNGAWRGDIDPTEAEWPAWSAAYGDAILGFATLAAQESVAGISIGSELRDVTRSHPEFWADLAARVRGVFPGLVTYAANWHEEFDEIPFWGALDAIGVDAFFPLTDGPDESLTSERCLERMGEIRDALRAVSARAGRPVLLTEIGYKSARGALWRPWEWEGAEPDPAIQAAAWDCIATVLGAAANEDRAAPPGGDGVSPGSQGAAEPWLTGLYAWNWQVDPGAGGATDTGFTVRDKPAEAILRAWFSARGPAGPRTPPR